MNIAMEDEGGVLLDGKALGNLRVVDLKQELEKRGLSKSGSKKDLVKRLKQQLEFEKLCGERKSTGDCDLKLELDADTEKNEFVQQYLAQQQKIYAEQKEVKRLIELEEIQKSGDERGSDSPKVEDASDHDTQDTSDNESPPEVFENVKAASSIQKREKKLDDVDSVKKDENDSRPKEIKETNSDSEKSSSPIKGGNVRQTTETETPLAKIKAEKMPAQSDSNEQKAMNKLSKTEEERVLGTKKEESSNQIKSVENVGKIDNEVKVEEDKKVESKDCIAGENSEDPSSEMEKSSVQSPDNLTTEPKTKVSNILDLSDLQPERKDENKKDKELISAKSTVLSSEVIETEPREVSNPQHSSNEPVIENQNVSEQPPGGIISTVLPSSSSVTDKSSESLDLVMEPATEVSPVPYALSENKENVIKPVPKPVHEENVSEVRKTSKAGGYAKNTDSDSESKSPASEKELSEPEDSLNLNGKSSRKKLVRGTSQGTDNPVKENKLAKDSASDRVVDKSQLKNVTRKEKSKTKGRKYSEDSEEGEMKSGSESKSGDSSDSSEHSKSRRKSRKGKRKVSRNKSSDSSRSRSSESSSVEKVVKRDNKGSSKSGSVSKSHDGSKKSKTKSRKGKKNSREVKKRRSRSGSSNSSRSRSRESSIEKEERTGNEGNSVSKSHGDANMQGSSKLQTTKSRQHLRVSKGKASRSESSNSSRSRSRGSSVEKVGQKDSESKIDASSFSKSHDSNEQEKLKPKISDSKRGRQDSKKDQRKISRSGSSSSRSRSRGNSLEKVGQRDSESKIDASSFSKSHDDSNEQEKLKPKTSGSKRGRQDSKKDQRKIRSGSSSSSRSRSRGSSIEKVGQRDSESKIDASLFSKSHDSNEQEKLKPKTSSSKRGRQDSKKDQRKISRSGSSSSSRSRSRGSSVEKVKRRNSEEKLKIDAGSFSKSHDDTNDQEKSTPKTSVSKRGRQDSRKDQRKISRSGSSSSSRSRSRGSSVEKVERKDSEENSNSPDDKNEEEKFKPETSDSKRGRLDSRKDKRKIRSGSSSSSRSRSRDNSVEKVEKMETEENSKASAGSVSKSHDDAVEKERKPETPQKRLKLKRDNVIVSDLPQAAKKDSSEGKTSQTRKDSDAEVDKPEEKNTAESTKQIEPQPVKYVSTRKIRISGRKVIEKSEDEPKVKRGKWGSYSSSQKPSKAISISTDSLKNWFPDFKLLKNPDVISETIEEMQVVSKEENHPDYQTEKIDESKHISQHIEMKDEQISEPVEQIDESEATNILFIQNLVRPFTLLQLKELLKETGNFIEEKFWIDKIKSKCFVTYSTVDEAIKTKSTLNGTRWPSSNPKILSVEFSTEEDLQLHQSGSEPPKPLPPPPPVENPEPLEEHSLEDLRRKERRRDRSRPQPVREWDKNKLTQESPTRERISRSIERSRSSDKKEKKDSKRRPNEDTPAKLLDDLFQKTKSSPCIYWLPLTEEQVVEREEARRLRRLEREKRIQQREQEEAEHKAKAAQSRNRGREMESRRSSTRSRSPVSRRR